MLRPDAEHELAFGERFADLRHRDRRLAEPDRPRSGHEAAAKAEEVHRRRADEVGDEQRRRPVVDLARRAELLDHALVHHGDPVGHRHRLELVVGDVDRGGAEAVVQVAQLAAHEVAELGVERAERLVHQEGLRPAHDGAAERHALAVARGEAETGRSSRWVMRRIRAASSTRALISARRMPWRFEREADIRPHVHVRIEREELEHEGDVALRGARLR